MVQQIRNTKQKMLLEKEFVKRKTLFSAHELLAAAQENDGTIGIATVYRFLKDKTKSEQLHSYVCDRKRIYSKDNKSHCHFLCTECKKFIHVHMGDVGFIKRSSPGKICHFLIEINGICKDCKE